MWRLLRIIPLLVLETGPKADDEPDFFPVFSEIRDLLKGISEKLPTPAPPEAVTPTNPAVPDDPANPGTVPATSSVLETPASQHKEPPPDPEAVSVEPNNPPPPKKYPWGTAKRKGSR